ncbi:MAG: GAF domain-containing protein [Blastocatellia bacterium]|nr:GAF domain-containing protein [Blastocatellia bacterium]
MSQKGIYYLSRHELESFVEPLREIYDITELDSEEQISKAVGIIFATTNRPISTSSIPSKNSLQAIIFIVNSNELSELEEELANNAYSFLPPSAPISIVKSQIENAMQMLRLKEAAEHSRSTLEVQTTTMKELNRIGMALSHERNIDKLLAMIVNKAMEITQSDAASLYLVEPDSSGGKQLRFKFSRNTSLPITFSEFTIPMSYTSIAGFVAETGIPLTIDDVYELPPEAPYTFNKSFDEYTGYRTKSMMVVPLLNAFNYVTGVLQLLNHKTNPNVVLDSPEATEKYVSSYPNDLVDVASSLGSQAAVAMENSQLYQDIRKLFEGFVNASVTAIEQRDPTTSGHSFRVADLTIGLAELVDQTGEKPFAGVKFSRAQLTEIRYASLLHDFGKVGVREEVLVKAKKLYPLQFELLKWRFDFYRQSIKLGYSEKKLAYLLEKGFDSYLNALPELDREAEAALAEAKHMWEFIVRSNEPTVLAEGSFEKLIEIANIRFNTIDNEVMPLLLEKEQQTLSIPKGSLNEDERKQIEQHAYHTYVFLKQIPWTEEWKDIPRIAGLHHEKLDGRGYPKGAKGSEIPIQSRMMSIADIFDALTASDRPYKRAVPTEKALDIIQTEVNANQLDPDLFRLFVASKVYQRLVK